MLVDGHVSLPVVVVAGYPRSGTTSLQTVVRAAYRSHIPEIDTADVRFSLWEYPKHSPGAIRDFVEYAAEDGRVISVVREFVDSAASLVVGRGGKDKVNIELEMHQWEKWLEIFTLPRVSVLSFASISSSTPHQLCATVARLVGIEPESPIGENDKFEDLMRRMGKGDPDSTTQSNLPSAARKRDLDEARTWVKESLGHSELTRLRNLYSEIATDDRPD